jgi:hypothetical protein
MTLPPGVGPSLPVTLRLTGKLCYRCSVPLTEEYGWRASNAARWSSYAAESRDCCKKCCGELERAKVVAIDAERTEWPSLEYGRIRAALIARGWRPHPGMETCPDCHGVGECLRCLGGGEIPAPARRWDFYAASGRWAIQWVPGQWRLGEAPDYDCLVERASGVGLQELLEELCLREVEA